ncbi:protein Niban 1a [Centropristis striata]|uniref:protein Niban 1a n=1 Tax=Centropristis striata TaxID=184440 RepID=UPI0027DFA7A4|nr:protein Niban 1a [Centropristis striata]
MGISASSLLDDSKSNYIKGEAEATLKEFSPYYRKQFSVTRFSQVEDDLEQHKEKITQLLQQKEAPEEGEVLYEEGVLYFDETRKWKDRYVVVRANYCLECHDSLETFIKGVPPRQKLLPTGGAVLTTEERYMAMVDRCFPDDTSVKEDFAPPLSGMPGQFPVYLRLPYRRDSYFCFRQQIKQDNFLSIMSDCIRHQNQDFLKKKTCEVQAFLKAIQLYRQDKERYEAWDMLIGSDVRVLANVLMEQLLPSLQKDMLPRLKAKKTEKKRVWFATVEAAYILIQEHLLVGLSALKEECRVSVRQQEVLLHSDMDQILNSRRQLEDRVRALVSSPAEQLCLEAVQPYLGSVLEELMEPVSSGFQEGRTLSENMMDAVCQDVLQMVNHEQLKKSLAQMSRPNLLSCYQKIGSLQEKLQHLQERFGFSNITGVIHSAQIDLQQLVENAAFTFQQLLHKAVQDNPENPGPAIDKNKHRVLKQYDYDSSTVRKRISREALVSITLPFIKRNLAPSCKTELQALEQSVYSDHGSFIQVENVYENVLLQLLDKEVTKVVKEAASLKKYNLFTDSRDLLSQSSRSSLSSPSVSTPGSPAMMLASPSKTPEPQAPSPLAVNGLSSSPEKEKEEQEEKEELQKETSTGATIMETPLGKVERVEAPQNEEEVFVQTVKAEEEEVPVAPEASADSTNQSETQEKSPETLIQEDVVPAEPLNQNIVAPKEPELTPVEVPAVLEIIKTDAVEVAAAAAAQVEDPAPSPAPSPEQSPEQSPGPPSEPAAPPAEVPAAPPAATSEEESLCGASEPEPRPEAPSGGDTAELPAAAADVDQDQGLQQQRQEAEQDQEVSVSDQNSLDVSVGGESAPLSDVVGSLEDEKTAPSSEDEEVSTTSDVLEDEENLSRSPVSSDEPAEEKRDEKSQSEEPRVDETTSSPPENAAEEPAPEEPAAKEPAPEEPSSVPEVPEVPEVPAPVDSIKEIRDLVSEVIEVEELVQRYPSGVPNPEE